MKKVSAIIISILVTSCTLFQKNTNSDDALVNEIQTEIDLNNVDAYPLFNNCDENNTKQLQKQCFEQQITQLFASALSDKPLVVKEDVNDTVFVYFVIDNNGSINFKRTEKSTKINQLLPAIDSLLKAKCDSFPPIFPAQKKGIKVAAKCKLPLIISSQ